MLPILLLAAAGFTVLTTEFMIVGLLPGMARDLGVSVSDAGLLVTLFAFTVASTGPILTAVFSQVERKKLFVGTLVLFSLANALAWLAPNINLMAVARLVPALALPVFWSLASVTAMELTGPERAGKAMSLVNIGIVCATVFGIPIATLVADALGWRAAFGLLALVALAKAIMLQIFFPSTQLKAEKASLLQQVKILRNPQLAGHVALSVLLFTAMFTAYTYLADMLERLGGLSGTLVGWTLMAFGAIGLLGNLLGGRAVDRNPLGGSFLFSSFMAVGMIMIALVPSMSTWWGMAGALGLWGVAQAALFIVCHVRLMKAASQAPAFAASLNISGADIGIGLGAIIGGRVIERFGIDKLGVASAVITGLALVLTVMLMPRPRLPTCVQVSQ